jgi:abortive infection bacteriophage resistance protein
MLKCAGRFFLYNEQQNPIPEAVHQCARPCLAGNWITLPTDALRIYFNLCIIKYFLNIISPNNDMKAKIDALLSAYPSIDTSAMGFPHGWENEPLWQ